MKRRSEFSSALLYNQLEARQLLAADVVINEFLASNSSDFVDGFGESSDWIELHNRGDESADLSGFRLTDNQTDLTKWTFPNNVTLGANQYLVVFASGRNLTTPDASGFLHTNFKLSAGGDYVALLDDAATPNLLSEFGANGQDYPAQETDISYGLGVANSTVTSLVGDEAPVTYIVPTATLPNFHTIGFDDSQFLTGNFGVGYDNTTTNAQFGHDLISRPTLDTASGGLFSIGASEDFESEGILTSWSFYSEIGNRQITPLIYEVVGDKYEIRGIGTPRVSGGGEQTFNFGLQAGSNFFGDSYAFGWKDGSWNSGSQSGANNQGVVPFTNNSTDSIVYLGGNNSSFSVGDSLSVNLALSRTYSVEATVETTLYDHLIESYISPPANSVYIRSGFELASLNDVPEVLTLRAKYDDAITVYLNGQEVFSSSNAPANPQYDSLATSSRPDSQAIVFEDIDITAFANLLVAGENVLAAQVFNRGSGSSDLLAVLELDGIDQDAGPTGYMSPPTPGAVNSESFMGFVDDTSFGVDRGFYDQAFATEVSTTTLGATLVYTTDGSEPTLTNGTQVFLGSSLAPTATVQIDTTTVLRAAAFKDEFEPTNVDTQTYVFADDVAADPGLFSTITNHPVWGPQIADSLKSVPTISLVTGNISTTEQATSVELIYPDGTRGFQVDAGVEHYGGHSLSSPKRNIRLSFKSIYGPSKLDYPLFDDPNAATSFDQILLRSGSHDNFFWTHPSGTKGVYFRSQLAYLQQRELGHEAPHGRFVQVFVNGEYAGIHNLMERPNAEFMASYLGGDDTDYDAINAGNAIDGDRVRWEQMIAAVDARDWNQIQQYLDVENVADYLLVEFWGGNDWDWNPSQNWAAAGARDGSDGGFKFFAWDSDVKWRTGANANILNKDGPEGLSQKLRLVPEFNLLLADRVQQHFFNGGVLSDASVIAQIESLEQDLELPLIAETARWGDAIDTYTPDTWRTHVDGIKNSFIPGRTATVFAQLQAAGFLPSIDAASFVVNGTPQHGGFIGSNQPLSIQSSEGTVYFTLDGTDPIDFDGTINGTQYSGPFNLDNGTTTVSARILSSSGELSALTRAEFVSGDLAAATNIRISEINYNPVDPTDAELALNANLDNDDFEFIEITNVHPTDPIDLTGIQFGDGVSFQFTGGFLDSGERGVIVRDTAAFRIRYGSAIPVLGQYADGLGNGGEKLSLQDVNSIELVSISYRDSGLFNPAADGDGATLVLSDPVNTPAAEQGKYYRWRNSVEFNGTPGAAESTPTGVVINEILANTDTPLVDAVELYNVTSSAINIGGWYLSDSGADLLSYQIPDGTTIPGNGYLVFEETDLGFALSSNGEQVYLTQALAGETTRIEDVAEFGATFAGESIGRLPNGSGRFTRLASTSFGNQNGIAEVGPLLISEVNYHPGDPIAAALAIYPMLTDNDLEFVEITNPTGAAIDMTNWRLRGETDFDFPSMMIASGQSVVVVSFDPNDSSNADLLSAFMTHYGVTGAALVGPFTGSLSNSFGRVALQQPDALVAGDIPRVVVDEVVYDDLAPWADADGNGQSLHRIGFTSVGNFATSWQATLPSPGSAISAPSVNSVQINDGSNQRSTVDKLVVTFDGLVDFDPGAFNITQRSNLSGATGIAVESAYSISVVDGNTVATITFTSLIRNSAGALDDGNYQLTIDQSRVKRAGSGVAMSTDYVFGATESDKFFALYGDATGDRSVNVFDLLLFRQSYRQSIGSSSYNASIDYEGNGIVNVFDLLKFRQRYRQAMAFI